ncbi:hypothetical protein GOV05_04115, partial [Candidatus Woesearchaeota archaeon]|nr:hypothetical protein [Candidatus Woesearchaeota archaeon]
MFKSRKRGQLTIFIILGVIILVMFSYMFYERSEKEKQEMFETINNQVTNIFQSTAMQNYVEICVEEKTNEALRILGDQGGYIFEDQGGTIPRTGSVNLGNHSMKYALDYDPTSPNCHPLFCPLVPIYPYRKIIDPAAPDIFKKLFNTSKINTTSPKSAYYGFVIGRFPALCLEDGLNWNASNGCHSAGYSPKGQNSIQEQLQDYIDNNLDDCLNFSSLFNDTGVYAHFDIEEKNTTTTIFFGESDLVVFVDYPLSLYSSTKNFKIVKNRFTVRIPNRIRKVWEHIYTLLSNDARNLFFDKKKPSIIMNPSTRWLSGFSYAYSETVATDDIYLVTDLYSLNKGKDYSFRVLIENRPPVLEYMHEDKNPGFSNRFDYVRLPGDTLELRPIGFDPDEDDVIYEYEGWMEDSYDTFNYSCCSAYGGSVNCVTTPDLCTVQQTDNSRDLNQWTESASYITSNQYAEYKIIDDDIGTHKLTVRVTDPGGLSDWQELNILVVDA